MLITKTHPYKFSADSLAFFYLNLKRRKQSARKKQQQTFIVSFKYSKCYPRIITRFIVFNICTSDLFYWVKEAELNNFADDNTISSAEFFVQKLLETLEKERQIATDWLEENNRIAHLDKFQAITKKQNTNYTLTNLEVTKWK